MIVLGRIKFRWRCRWRPQRNQDVDRRRFRFTDLVALPSAANDKELSAYKLITKWFAYLTLILEWFVELDYPPFAFVWTRDWTLELASDRQEWRECLILIGIIDPYSHRSPDYLVDAA